MQVRLFSECICHISYCQFSIRTICAYTCKHQVTQGPSSPEDSIYRVQPTDTCSWPLEVSFYGPSTNWNRRLACIRESSDGESSHSATGRFSHILYKAPELSLL